MNITVVHEGVPTLDTKIIARDPRGTALFAIFHVATRHGQFLPFCGWAGGWSLFARGVVHDIISEEIRSQDVIEAFVVIPRSRGMNI